MKKINVHAGLLLSDLLQVCFLLRRVTLCETFRNICKAFLFCKMEQSGRIHFGDCAMMELHELMPPSPFHLRWTRLRLGFHPYVVDLPTIRTKKFASFIMHTAKEWNELPADLFPEQYNLGLFKARVNRHFSREIVKGTIRRTLIEVAESGEWSSLRDAVNTIVRRTSSALSKRADHEKLKCSCKDIAHELESKREQWALELQDADRKIALLQDKMRDDTLNANTRLCYAEKWLCARAESLELQHQEPRAPAPRSDLEQRAHDELVKAFQLQIKEREELLEHWRLRYADDIADMNERVSAKNLQVQVTVARHDELQQLYDLHEGEMRGWLTFKRERAARLAREERQRLAATRMQAWWRGAMVRRALGSFRYLRNVKKSPSKTKKK